MAKKALVIGSSGQDGQILSEQLNSSAYECAFWTRDGYRVDSISRAISLNIVRFDDVRSVVERGGFDEIYFLAAAHHSSSSTESELPFSSYLETNVVALENFLRAIKESKRRPRIFYASSCHVFGEPAECPQRETTLARPDSFYGITKLAASNLCAHYRKHHDLFASVGILYNHESYFRKQSYFSKRFSHELAEVVVGKREGPIRVGNLNAVVDWLHASDVTRAMQMMLALDEPRTYVIASGVARTIRDWVEVALRHVGFGGRFDLIQEDPALARKLSVLPYVGDATSWRIASGWEPRISFEQMVCDLLNIELVSLKS